MLGLALAVAGCATSPGHRDSSVGVPPRFSRVQQEDAYGPGDVSGFWRRLEDPILSELVEEALVGSTDLRSARARLLQARARRDFARADRFPTLGFSGSVTRRRSGTQRTITTGDGSAALSSSTAWGLYDAGFDASWEADVFGGKRRAQVAAQADLEASAADLGATQVSLVAEVALSYVELRSFQARLAIARRNLETQSET
ncbi:MAG: TolC family protein, partial [Polyangiaceae bacterium]|nr:TolC family protein [Polyangiaceae bacterium]